MSLFPRHMQVHGLYKSTFNHLIRDKKKLLKIIIRLKYIIQHNTKIKLNFYDEIYLIFFFFLLVTNQPILSCGNKNIKDRSGLYTRLYFMYTRKKLSKEKYTFFHLLTRVCCKFCHVQKKAFRVEPSIHLTNLLSSQITEE